MKSDKPKKQYRYRSSVTGRFVTKEFAKANPRETQETEIKPRDTDRNHPRS
jgi:hypothetical protein